jgi:two-component system, LytTR family, response regulator
MKCIIVDDNKLARTSIRQLITNFEFLHLRKEFDNAQMAYSYLRHNAIDLVFLDVEMPGMTGLELIRNMEKRPLVILVTAKRDYAVEAYELNVADYMIKPVTLARFSLAVSRAKKLFSKEKNNFRLKQDYIFVRSNSILTRLNSNRIVYVHATGNQVHIHTTDKSLTVNSNLKSIQERLPIDKFCRSHSSYLVAIDKIEAVDGDTVQAGSYNIPIGKQFKTKLIRKLNLIH